MNGVMDVAKLISLMSSYGYSDIANEYAAIHALNSSSTYKGDGRRRAVEDALAELVAAKAVFDVSGAYRICLDALKVIDSAAGVGVELSMQDALNCAIELMEMDNV